MTDDKIALRELLEKGSDATFLREMIGFAAERLMALETEVDRNGMCAKNPQLTVANFGSLSRRRGTAPFCEEAGCAAGAAHAGSAQPCPAARAALLPPLRGRRAW